MATYSNSEIRLRIDNQQNWNQNKPVLAAGEIGIVSDANISDFKVGDGSKRFDSLSYFISENKEVKTAKTNAATALSTANTASSNAAVALERANAALNQGGRQSDKGTLEEQATGRTLTVNDEFVKKFRNYNLQSLKSMTQFTLKIDDFQLEVEKASEIAFYFVTGDNGCKISSSRMTRTLSEVESDNKLFLVVKNANGIDTLTIGDSITFKVNVFVKLKIVDTWLLELDAISLA